MKIGLIGAMEEEIRLLKQALQQESEQVVAGYTFYQGQLWPGRRLGPIRNWEG